MNFFAFKVFGEKPDKAMMSQIQDPPDYRDSSGEYLPISLEGLSVGILDNFDLFIRAGKDFFLVKPKNLKADRNLVSKYRSQTPYLYLRAADRESYFKKIEASVSNVMKSPQISIREKAAVLTDCAVEIVDRLFSDPGNPGTISSAKTYTENCVLLLGQQKQAFLHLVELSNHDHYTYAHSVGVAAYTIALARETGKYSNEELATIGLAGLLHDIGKCMVDPSIINKKGPLSEDEWAVMKKHPEYGGEILRRHRDLAPIVGISAEAHHESLLGTGYPKKLKGLEIDEIVRIVSLSDAFSALTTKRSYSPSRDSLNALLLMKENIDKKFDANLFKKFVVLFLDPAQEKKAA